ncbi:MAG: nucleotidyl transferase AbiEii/AbiGii toxin family protein [Bacteroidota bacterium]|nr:nucleotidyl transferase AbiEii/AbiGii toxin family protein [Bacteroidota bacterium]
MLQTQSVPPGLLGVLHKLMAVEKLKNFRLVGGTALALQFGHRVSVDIDLFTDKSFDKTIILSAIIEIYQPERVSKTANGLTFFIQQIKIDLCNWAVPFIGKLIEDDGIRMASPEDIGAFKLDAVVNRKEQKDFYDLYFLLTRYSFETLIQSYRQKYPYNNMKDIFIAIASISEADVSASPILTFPVQWDLVKENLKNQTQTYLKNLQELKITEEQIKQKTIQKLLEQKSKIKKKAN